MDSLSPQPTSQATEPVVTSGPVHQLPPDPHRKRRVVIVIFLAALAIGLIVLVAMRILKYGQGEEEPLVPTSTFVPDMVLPEQPDMFPDDLDRDGISNAEEEAMGLSPTEYDTDRDGLSDQEEIEVWQTDPKVTDTDGDGYADGFEVLNGFDPLGPGRLEDGETPSPREE